MSKSLNILAGALALTCASNAFAASSVDLSVRGTITPNACVPSVSNNGETDLGKISAKDLRPDLPTYLPRQVLQMTVTCDGTTLMAIESKDNREGTEYSNDYYNFGLGLTPNDEKLGYLTVGTSNRLADGVTVRGIGSRDGGVTWDLENTLMDDGINSVAATGTMTPIPLQQLTMDLSIGAVIAPATRLTLSNEVPIDGSVTMTVRYL